MNDSIEEVTDSVSKSVKRLSKWPFAVGIVIIVVVVTLPLILGELHGNIPNAIQEGSDLNQDGYKVTYGFDFIPSMFKFVGDSVALSYFAIFGMIILAITPIASVMANYLIRNRELRNEALPQELAHKKEMQELQINIDSTLEDKRHQYNLELKEQEHKHAIAMEQERQQLELQKTQHNWKEDERKRQHEIKMTNLENERERQQQHHEQLIEEKKLRKTESSVENKTSEE